MYTPQKKDRRECVCFRLNNQEREQIEYVMTNEMIPDTSKAIRYCIAEKAQELQKRNKKAQKGKAVKHG